MKIEVQQGIEILVVESLDDIWRLSLLKKSVCHIDGTTIFSKKCLNASFLINMNGREILKIINSGIKIYEPK